MGSFLANYWTVIVAIIFLAIVVLVYVVPQIVEFIGYPSVKRMEIIKKFLLKWVTEAETKFDNGDFDLILNYCYTAFVNQFPFVSKWFSEEQFKALVNDAIDELKEVLSKNGKTLASLKNSIAVK